MSEKNLDRKTVLNLPIYIIIPKIRYILPMGIFRRPTGVHHSRLFFFSLNHIQLGECPGSSCLPEEWLQVLIFILFF